ncbi:hypothetical protein [Streptomyces sp. NPDC020597]|uniref:hypothetical protein n=1 Tax=unclassified Streptomyces TaxID=2593676 RepID=UPI0037AB87AA
MTIEYTSPSGDARRTAMRGVEHVARLAGAPGGPTLTEADVALSAPHRVHHVGLDHLVARRPLTDCPVTGWRYLVLADGGAVASSELSAGAGEGPLKLEQVNTGPYVQSTAAALQRLAENPEIRSGRFELHMLKIPALSTFLLWLHQLDGDADLFSTLPPAPGFLEAGRLYRENELLDLMEGPARRCLEFDTTPRNGNGPAQQQ